MCRLEDAVEESLGRRHGMFGRCCARLETQSECTLPGGVNDFGEVAQGQPTRRCVETSEMEQNVGFHWREQGEPRYPSCLVEKVCPRDGAIFALLRCISNNQIDQIHLSDDILECADVRIGNLAARRYIAKSMKIVEKVI